MPRLLLEGKSITALLAQVRAEHGDDVTIVAAEKLRSGGLGGFFARESYALTVEVDRPDATTGRQMLMHEPTDDSTGTNRTQIDALLMHEHSARAQAPGSLLDLAAAIDEAEATENSVILATRPMHGTVQQPVLSTASPEFAAILARLTALDAPPPVAAVEVPELSVDATEPASQADAYARLRDVLAEIAPHLDFTTSVPLVLVIPPAVAAPQAAIPRQGRHRRGAEATS